MKKLTNILSVIIATLLSIGTVVCFYNVNMNAEIISANQNNPDYIINEFIISMQNENYSYLIKLIQSNDLGKDGNVFNNRILNIAVDNPAIINELESKSSLEILKSQHDFIRESFGADAWSNVKYSIEKVNCPEKMNHISIAKHQLSSRKKMH